MIPKIIILNCLILSFLFSSQQTQRIDELKKLSLEDLLEIKITTAAKKPQKIFEIPSSVVVITAEEIENLGYRSYTDILNNVSGYQLIDDYHYLGHKNFSVRGFFSPGAFSNVVILVNGVPQLSDEYMEYPDTKITVPIEAIDRIEVIRGPMSVIYGNGAFFGAINIITNKNYNSNKLTLGAGDNNRIKTVANISKKTDKLKYKINTGFHKSDGLNVPFTKLTSDKDIIEYSNNPIHSTTRKMLERSDKYFDFSFQSGPLYGIFSYNESMREILDGMPGYGSGNRITHSSTNINLGYNKKLSKHFNIKGQAGFYYHSHLLDYERLFAHSFDLDSKTTRSIDLDLTINYNPSTYHQFLFGGYARNVFELFQIADFPTDGINRADGEIMVPRDKSILTTAIYSQYTFSPIKQVDIITGFRIEHLTPYTIVYSRGLATLDTAYHLPPENRTLINGDVAPQNKGYALTPRLALLYKLNKKHVFKLLYGSAIKQPTFMDNLRQIIMQRPILNVQRINTIELNIVSTFSKNLRTNFSFFYNNLTDLITATNEFSPETGWIIFSANSGQFETIGTELCARANLLKNLHSKLSFIYQKTTNKKDGYQNIPVGYSPDLLVYSSMVYHATPNLTIALRGKYIDKMLAEWTTATTPEAGSRLGKTISPYFLFDLNLRLNALFNSPLSLNFNVKNIFDTEIRYPTTKSNSWIDKGYIGPKRNYLITINYEF